MMVMLFLKGMQMKIVSIRNLALVGVFIAAVVAVVLWQQTPTVPVTTLTSVDTLQRQFEQDAGKSRLVLLISPT